MVNGQTNGRRGGLGLLALTAGIILTAGCSADSQRVDAAGAGVGVGFGSTTGPGGVWAQAAPARPPAEWAAVPSLPRLATGLTATAAPAEAEDMAPKPRSARPGSAPAPVAWATEGVYPLPTGLTSTAAPYGDYRFDIFATDAADRTADAPGPCCEDWFELWFGE